VAEATARELLRISLTDALELTILIARKEPRRHPRVADDPTWGFGVNAGLVAAGSGLVTAILSLLPGNFGSEARKLPHFLVTDLTPSRT
jgi:hypothetical protein